MSPTPSGVPVGGRRRRDRPPAVPVIANSPDARYGDDADANGSVLVGQLTRPVDFAARVQEMYEAGYRVFVEFGPKSVLSGLVRKILDHHDDVVVVASDTGPKGDGDRSLKQLVARLAVLGLPLSGFNRYSVPTPEAVEGKKGMRIPLNGVNYVSEERRGAYRDGLENGYRVPASPAAAPLNGNGHPAPAAPAAAAGFDSTLAGYHLALHREYLSSQLRLAERLSGILEHDALQGTLNDRTVAGLASVSDHGVSIGQAHSQASEVLLGFAYLEAGLGGAAPAPVRHTVEQLPRPRTEMGHSAPRQAIAAPAAPIAPVQPVAVAPVAPAAPVAPVAPAPVAPAPAAAAPAAPAAQAGDVETIKQVLLGVVSEKTGYPTDMLDLDMDVEADLGIDSIKRVEIMGALQERFPGSPQAGPEQMGELRSLGGIVAFIAGAISGTGGAEAHHPKADGASRIGRMQARLLQLPAVLPLVGAYAEQPVALLAGDGSALTEPLTAALTAAGWTVRLGTEPPAGRLDLVVFTAPDAPADWSESIAALQAALLVAGSAQRALEAAAGNGRAAFVTVSRIDGLVGLSGGADAAGLLGGLPGLVKTFAIEAPALFCRALDLSPELGVEAAVGHLIAEINDADTAATEVGVAADLSRRTLAATLEDGTDPLLPQGESVAEPTPDDLFVVTGGGRGVTASCTIGLARRHRSGMLLLGRSPLAEEPAYAAGVPDDALKGAIVADLRAGAAKPTPKDVERIYRGLVASREIRQTLAAVAAAGATAEYLAVDVTDAAATAKALAPYRDRISGLIHGAGVLADKAVVNQRAADVGPVLATKLAGLRSVLDAVGEDRLKHVVLFSSVAGFFGNRGQSSYASANEALNRIATTLRRRLPATRVTSVNWGAGPAAW